MKHVVDSLGDPEEVGVAFDDHPSHVHACAAAVGDERREQLRDSPATCGRVDVPDDAPREVAARTGGGDPDGNALSYEWFCYPEAGTFVVASGTSFGRREKEL